jgi:aspartyl protease family protein
MATSDFASLAYAIALVVMAAGVAFTLYRIFAQAIRVVILWVLFAALLAAAYTYRSELRETGDLLLAELFPGHLVSRGRTVTVARTGTGDFAIRAEINGARVAMVFDTGASSIVLTHDDAKAAGLPLELLDYTVNIDTANGRARAAKVTLDRIGIGSLVERSVDALVAQPGQLQTSLLGMSFLNRLQKWEVSGDRLFLSGYP